ncbi:MAG: hypothetical protein IH934_04710 [Nanoarchaeota archaeon]|nr:hypothetical protein [Nanoarchaeota archaeon]
MTNNNNWRKGLTKNTDKRIMNISKALKEKYKSDKNIKCGFKKGNKYSFKKGHIPFNKGKKGLQVSWNKGKKGIYSKNYIKKLSESHIGKKDSTKTKLKKSINAIRRWKNKDYAKKCLRRNDKSSLEIKFEQIILKNNLPYKFVGNGDFFVSSKCPDFINVNCKKIAIEVYYTRHKEKFRGGYKMWRKNRTKLFKNYGWEIKYFNEIQVNEKEILRRLG